MSKTETKNDQSSITSKYFSENGMDESLSDFQEKKQFLASKIQKPTSKRSKKPLKRPRGQKDIKSALSKKSELVAYSKNFDNICKQSGLDVDPEQLQLAIALSKSLQESNPKCEDPRCDEKSYSSGVSSSQERVGKIRTTLLEYGFKVPDIKVVESKRNKKRRKNYKLLTVSLGEKKQIISDRYSKILFDTTVNTSSSIDNIFSETRLFNLATNVSYDSVRTNDIFYVEDLLPKAETKLGTLLRSWSNIPGRPVSPDPFKGINMNFSIIDCSQDEINSILSGTIKSVKNILSKKVSSEKIIDLTTNPDCLESKTVVNLKNNLSPVISDSLHILPRVPETRSLSPDLFDDEATTISDDVQAPLSYSQDIQSDTTEKFNHEYMDLTECVRKEKSVLKISQPHCKDIQLSQDKTLRKSDDFMEITECAVHPLNAIAEENIDLTHSCDSEELYSDCPDIENDKLTVKETVDLTAGLNIQEVIVQHDQIDLDLTQSDGSDDDTLPFVQISGTQKENQNPSEQNTPQVQALQDNELKESSIEINCDAQNGDLPLVENINQSNSHSFEDFPFQHSNNSKKLSCSHTSEGESGETVNLEDRVDLTQSSNSSADNIDNQTLGKIDDVSIDYDEIQQNLYDCAASTSIKCIENENIDINNSIQNNYCLLSTSHKVDIEYDYPINNEIQDNSFAVVLEISDAELNATDLRPKDKSNNFDIGGLSVIGGLSSIQSFKKSNIVDTTNDRTLANQSLSQAIIRTPNAISDKAFTSEVNISYIGKLNTPVNKEFIVKTVDVTPMLDYTAMSTPERNKELDKYGLKPFKRKRAIQLLTHLYNQTHPFVEQCPNSEMSSPSKKRKNDLDIPSTSSSSPVKKKPSIKMQSKSQSQKSVSPLTSPEKLVMKSSHRLAKSPKKLTRKAVTSPQKRIQEVDKENLFEVTNVVPKIKHIDCDPDDWVLPKREKGKIRSCAVPLHISFHNLLCCCPRLHHAVLRYEPIDIDTLEAHLTPKYHRKDLLRFLDKKCITVKTADNNARNRRH